MISIFQGTDKNCDMKYRRGQKINSLLIPNFKYREARIFYLSRDLSTIIFILNIDVRIFYFSRFIGHHFYFKCREARISGFAWFADNQFNYRVTILVSSRYDRFTGATDKNGNATFVFYMAYTEPLHPKRIPGSLYAIKWVSNTEVFAFGQTCTIKSSCV